MILVGRLVGAAAKGLVGAKGLLDGSWMLAWRRLTLCMAAGGRLDGGDGAK
jgi:hypothetical protein